MRLYTLAINVSAVTFSTANIWVMGTNGTRSDCVTHVRLPVERSRHNLSHKLSGFGFPVRARYCYCKSSVRPSVCGIDVPWAYRLD